MAARPEGKPLASYGVKVFLAPHQFVGAWCNGSTSALGAFGPSSNLGAPKVKIGAG